MNPRYGHWPDDCPAESAAPARMRAARVLRERWVTDWREARLLARRPGFTPPPRDQLQWLAWALGKPTTGPRWVREDAAGLAERAQMRKTEGTEKPTTGSAPRWFLNQEYRGVPRPPGAPPALPPSPPTKGRIARVRVGPVWLGDGAGFDDQGAVRVRTYTLLPPDVGMLATIEDMWAGGKCPHARHPALCLSCTELRFALGIPSPPPPAGVELRPVVGPDGGSVRIKHVSAGAAMSRFRCSLLPQAPA